MSAEKFEKGARVIVAGENGIPDRPSPRAGQPVRLGGATMTPDQEGQFVEVLLAAYSFPSLERLVRFKMNDDIYTICGPGNFKDAATSVVLYYNKRGRAYELLRAARSDNPGNLKLKAFSILMGEG
jgi:hypothetical protein